MYNNLYVVPGNFLATVCPLKKKTSTEPPDIPIFLRQELATRDKIFSAQVNSYYNRLILWITQMNSDHLKEG
jgi:hypothetical protein